MFLFIFTLRYVIAPFRYLSRPLISAALAPALPWRVDWIHGARDSGGQRAWVSADPVGLSQRRSGGMSQRRSGGHWVRGGRRALSQRRAGGHWVRGGPAGIESEAGRRRDLPRTARLGERQPRNQTTSRRAWESHRRRQISPAIRGHEGSRPEDSRHSRRSRRTPTPSCSGLWREDECRLPCHGTNRRTTKQKTFKNGKQNGVNGRRLRLGLVFCHGAHTREKQGHTDEDVNSNYSL